MLKMLGFIATVVVVYTGMQSYVAFWLLRSFPGLPVNRLLLRAVILLTTLAFPLSLYCLRMYRGTWTVALAYASFLWLGVIFLWLGWAALGDIVVLFSRFLGAAEAVRPWARAAVLTATAVSCLWSLYNAARMPAVKDVEISLAGLSPQLEGFSIVQLSDLHLGVTVSIKKFSRIVDLVSSMRPDLIVLTGDIFDAGLGEGGDIERSGLRLKAKRGVFAVLGNHEFYHGVEASSRTLSGMGAHLLRNAIVVLPGGLQLAGVDDVMAGHVSRQEVAALLAKLDAQAPSIYLCHQPLGFAAAAHAGVSLMLSGHTHDGQLFPFGLIVRLFYGHLHGLYQDGASWLYVTSGTGQWGPPMRFLTRAEIVRFTLRGRAS